MVSGNSTSEAQVLKLIQEKERIEKEIENHGIVLRNNNIGFNEPLTDEEGFPRNDVDVRSVRLARTQIICLQNDLKNVMKAIDDGLGKYFAEKKDVQESLLSNHSKLPPQMSGLSVSDSDLKPFLVVNLVSENSPGFMAGIMLNDLIISFGSINCKNFKDLSQIGELVKSSQNHQVRVKLRRNGNDLDLILVPKTWSGQGLLGFKVAALPSN